MDEDSCLAGKARLPGSGGALRALGGIIGVRRGRGAVTPRAAEALVALHGIHFWFRSRRELVLRLLRRLASGGGRLLDVGCGPGFAWPGFDVTAADADPRMASEARRRGLRAVLADAAALPFADGSFDAALLLDVLEHLGDDGAAVREAARVLRPGGVLIASVPLHPWLWSRHDEECGHRRRYRPGEMPALLERAGLRILHRTCWNLCGLPALAALRPLGRGRLSPDGGPAGRIAALLLGAEARLAARLGIPWGMSEFAAAGKPRGRRGA